VNCGKSFPIPIGGNSQELNETRQIGHNDHFRERATVVLRLPAPLPNAIEELSVSVGPKPVTAESSESAWLLGPQLAAVTVIGILEKRKG
jgi:hypothetical protein